MDEEMKITEIELLKEIQKNPKPFVQIIVLKCILEELKKDKK